MRQPNYATVPYNTPVMVLGALAGLLTSALLWTPRTHRLALPAGGVTGLGLIVVLSIKLDDDRWERSPEGLEAYAQWAAHWHEMNRLDQIEAVRYQPIDFPVPRGGVRFPGPRLDSQE